jgi:hypothetical protein
MTQNINGNLKQFLTVIKNAQASLTHIDVHFLKGGVNSATSLEEAGTSKRKEYQVAYDSFLKIVEELKETSEHRSEKAATLCKIERFLRSINFHPSGESKANMVTFGINYDGVFTREALSFISRSAKIKYHATEGFRNYLLMRAVALAPFSCRIFDLSQSMHKGLSFPGKKSIIIYPKSYYIRFRAYGSAKSFDFTQHGSFLRSRFLHLS